MSAARDGSPVQDYTDAAVSAEDVVVDGHRLRYYEAGEGPPLLLLHGGIIDAALCSWGEVIGPLSESFRVVAPDLLGYGDSARPDVPYSLDRHVEVVRGLYDELDLAGATVCGLSMGGGIALGLALDTDADVSRLALLDSYGLGRELANGRLTYVLSRTSLPNKVAVALFARSRALTKASLASVAKDPDGLSQSAVDCVWALSKREGVCLPFRRFRRHEVTREGYRTTFEDRFGDVSIPTYLLHGEHDEVFPVAWAERAAERIPDATLAVLEDCAHWAPREDPDTVVRHLRAFAGEA